MLCHLTCYVLFSKVNTFLCSTAHATLFKWSCFIVFSVSHKTNDLVNEVCSWTHFKQVEACCEHARSPLASKAYGGSQMENGSHHKMEAINYKVSKSCPKLIHWNQEQHSHSCHKSRCYITKLALKLKYFCPY